MSMGLILIWVFSTVTLLNTCSLALTEDGITLLEIKRSFNHTKGFLSDWRPSDDSPCGWKGITCNHNDSRVSVMYSILNPTLFFFSFFKISISIFLKFSMFGVVQKPSLHATRRHHISKHWKAQQFTKIVSPPKSKDFFFCMLYLRCNLVQFVCRALHQNSLHGFIPSEIANCKELRSMYLRGNYLQGGIPPELGKLSYLTILDLSSNSLRGTIPSSIGYLRQLHFLNLSTNFFSGAIPDLGVLSTFRKKSFIGNLDLCGPQIMKPCQGSLGFPAVLPHGPHAESEEAPAPTKRSSRYLKGILIGAMSAVGLAIAILFCFLWFRLLSKKERAAKRYNEVKRQAAKDERTQVVTFHGDLPYSSSDIVEKLESLDVGDVLGSGGFGTVYKMVMNDRTTFAVKRIDKCLEGSDQTFERELEILASIKHVNLVNLRGYCKFPCAKLLIYDYLTLGSLDHFLHDEDAHVTTVVAGTFGYLAPAGKRPNDSAFVKRGLNIVGWMNTLVGENQLEDIVDSECTDADIDTLEAVLVIAARCTDANPDDRPSMNQVFQMLEELASPCPSEFYESHSDDQK
ncbi:hypothetical protein MKX01_024263 [Papaver californicum]|nr:hypothetical protein MKX01_024263 [Papaver californicum]